MLFVRACKSKNPKKRLKSLVKRFYIPSNEHDTQRCLEHNLLQIAEKYNCISLSKFAKESSSTYMYFDDNEVITNIELNIRILTSCIKLSKVSKFPIIIKPLYWRNKNEKT